MNQEIVIQPDGSTVDETVNVIVPAPPPRVAKKRKHATVLAGRREAPNLLNEHDDNGSTCSICLDNWDLAGPHRLTSLKCGHLFGNSCIKRWLDNNVTRYKLCPQCKKRANLRDFRYIFAKRITAIDNSEEVRLRAQLKSECSKYLKLEKDYSLLLARYNNDITDLNNTRGQVPNRSTYKLSLERNIQMENDVGCHVMVYNSHMNSMIVTHKWRHMHRGYGAHIIDLATYSPSGCFRLSQNDPRDLALSISDNLLVAASLEKTTAIYDLNNRSTIAKLKAPTSDLQALFWSCCFNQARSQFLYLGTNHGKTYVYDIRQPNQIYDELITLHDCWPVINVVAIPPFSPDIELGGILVCKLNNLWFYEYQSASNFKCHELNMNDSYNSMSYDIKSNQVLLTTSKSHALNVRFIVGNLIRRHSKIVFDIKTTGSLAPESILRSTIINMNSNPTDSDKCIVAGYQEEIKQLNLWCANTGDQLYSVPIQNTIYDLTSFQHSNNIFLGGLAESELNIYKIYDLISDQKLSGSFRFDLNKILQV